MGAGQEVPIPDRANYRAGLRRGYLEHAHCGVDPFSIEFEGDLGTGRRSRNRSRRSYPRGCPGVACARLGLRITVTSSPPFGAWSPAYEPSTWSYRAAISAAYFSMTTARRTLSVGVSWPSASLKSSSRIANFLIASARDTA